MNLPFPLGRQARIAVLASGRGSNLQALLDSFGPAEPLGRVVLVVSDKTGAQALERARKAGVEALHIGWTTRSGFERQLLDRLRETRVDLICLAGFMRLLSADFVAQFDGRLLNIHPSLLPKFRGLHPQRQALEAGAVESGCTVHYVDSGVDTGAIILQRSVPVMPGDDQASLSARILEEEHRVYPQAVRLVLSGEARPEQQAEGA